MARITGTSPFELASMKEVKPNDSKTGISESFVSVDIDEIKKKADDEFSSSSPRVVSVMKKNLSRKVSPADGDQHRSIGRSDASERAHLTVQMASGGEATAVLRAASPAPEAERWKAWRRVGARRPSPWLDPRRVVIVFATMSSMGTLLLLYFTLSMGKMDSGNSDNA